MAKHWQAAQNAADAAQAATLARAPRYARECAKRALRAASEGDKARACHWLDRAQAWRALAQGVR